MNIILSCAADKKKFKGAFVIYKGGKAEVKDSFAIANKGSDSTLKEYVFDSLVRGLRNVRNLVSHEDLLLVKLPNAHMVEWLNGSKEYKGYSKYLDEITDIIDTLDCKYLFTVDSVKDAKKLLDVKEKAVTQGISEAFEGLE